jgi:hypothetical protein
VPNFVDRGVSRCQHDGTPTVVKLNFLDRSRYFLANSCLFNLTRAEWTPFQTYCYSDNLVAQGIDPGTSDSVARNSDHGATEALTVSNIYYRKIIIINRMLIALLSFTSATYLFISYNVFKRPLES